MVLAMRPEPYIEVIDTMKSLMATATPPRGPIQPHPKLDIENLVLVTCRHALGTKPVYTVLVTSRTESIAFAVMGYAAAYDLDHEDVVFASRPATLGDVRGH